jgi:predicted site-specific integrase-resolvase
VSRVPKKKGDPSPYSLSIQGASDYFGVPKQTLYNWIYGGRLLRGVHYLSVGRKPLIIREGFAEFLKDEQENKAFSVSEVAEILQVDKEIIYGWLSDDGRENAVIPPDGWFRLPGSEHIRIKEWAMERLKAQHLPFLN